MRAQQCLVRIVGRQLRDALQQLRRLGGIALVEIEQRFRIEYPLHRVGRVELQRLGKARIDFAGLGAQHRIQGISDEFIPAIVQLDQLDEIIDVADGDAILLAQQLASRLGLGVGISSGANFLAALQVQEQLGPEAVVVTIFCDDNKKYLSTDLLRSEPVKEGYWSPEVDLICYEAYRRAR